MSDALVSTRTWAHQSQLPNLPIPPLEDTCRRYLTALKGLQDEKDHENTKRAVQAFLQGDGPRVQQSLIEYAKNKPRCVFASQPPTQNQVFTLAYHSYIEDFWYDRQPPLASPSAFSLS
jgi:carnitine O-acetyltransferase